MTAVTPPATGEWWDQQTVLAAALLQLRLIGGDVDKSRVAELIPAAAAYIDDYVDRETVLPGPPPPPLIHAAQVDRVVANYLGHEPDPVVEARRLTPHKRRFGTS